MGALLYARARHCAQCLMWSTLRYVNYENAVFQALIDRHSGPEPSTKFPSHEFKSCCDGKRMVVVMVVGSGRGPLVKAVLRAAERVGMATRVKVFAIEKNPNAVVTLRNMKVMRYITGGHWFWGIIGATHDNNDRQRTMIGIARLGKSSHCGGWRCARFGGGASS